MNDSSSLGPVGRAQLAVTGLRALASGEALTDSARAALLAWPGWGALTPAFEQKPTGAWAQIREDLIELLDDDAFQAASGQVDTSFFTPAHVTAAVFDLLTAGGFTGGQVLEPGCGSGRFMAAAPAGLDIQWTGVEIDPTAAAIAQALNPDATIISAPLQKTILPTARFDAVVGNVPFGQSYIYDQVHGSANLHGYFLRRSLDAVREGGYVILVTSRHQMDTDKGVGSLLSEFDAELVAAVRLPAGTFSAEGTDAVADILAFRKNVAGEPPLRLWDDEEENAGKYSFEKGHYSPRPKITEKVKADGYATPVSVNAYWAAHPEHVAGTMKLTGYSQWPLTVVSENPQADIAAAVVAARAAIVPQAPRAGSAADEFADVVLVDEQGRAEGSFHILDDGSLVEIIDGKPSPLRNSVELRALIGLRDAAKQLLALESDPNTPDDEITPIRDHTHALYTAYAKKFGPLNRGTRTEGKPDPDTGDPTYTWRRPALGGFRRDPDYVIVMALEQFDQDTGDASPAPILLRRVNHKVTPAETAETAAEALSISRGENRGVDLNRIAGLLGLPSRNDAIAALGDLTYHDGRQWVPANDYLAGNIRVKLAAARELAAKDGSYARNVTALEKVLPADLGPLEIRVKLGAPWIPDTDVNEFAREVLGTWAGAKYSPAAAIWEVTNKDGGYTVSQTEFGTARMSALTILEHALNGAAPVVYDEVRHFDYVQRTRNVAETITAEEKLRALEDRFSTWLWEDGDRADRLCRVYNDRFNSYVARVADGSGLTFPGLSDTVTPWAHQRNAVDLAISTERVLIGHPVGAGKTLSMILTAMTLRRMGLANKPLIAVPNHLLDQIVREAQQAFPTGKFLIASKEDLTKERRRLFAARAATGDWDAIVMTHQAFGSLPVDPKAEAAWIQNEKFELRQAILADAQAEGKRAAKAVARAMKSLEARLEQLRYGMEDENQVLFDHLGVDYLMVDEAHMFRRLATGSTSRNSGFSSGSSKRATDLLLKIETLAERHPGKPVVSLFTGTPWSNTLAETWVWQRFLQPDLLRTAGVLSFDPWVAMFVRYETNVEVAPDGSGFRMHRRPVGLRNLPELKSMLRQVADILSPEKIGLERPEHTIHKVVSQPTPGQKEFVTELARRADRVHEGNPDKRTNADGTDGEDSMLIIGNDGRAVALDPRLVGVDEQSQKLADNAAKIAAIYRENADRNYGQSTVPGAFQLVLIDLGTPQPGDSKSYGRLRHLLVEAGIPAAKIRFIHEAKTDKARAALFSECRDGAVSVLIGSTPKVGTGTNIQTRLRALWHIDIPWTPAEVIQREGRALRPGNLNDHVDIYRCVTEGTFDAYTWSAVERKERSFYALYDDDPNIREIDDIGEVALGYGEMKALAAGNPLLLEQAKLAHEVQRLRLMRSVFLQDVHREQRYAADEDAHANNLVYGADKLEKTLASITPADLPSAQAIGRLVNELKDPETRWYGRHGWRALTLQAKRVQGLKRETVEIEVMDGYRDVHSLTLSRGDLVRPPVKLAEMLEATLNEWADTLGARIDNQRASAERSRRNAEDARARAEQLRFDQEDRLQAAIAELARVDRLIEEAATRDRNAVPAAA